MLPSCSWGHAASAFPASPTNHHRSRIAETGCEYCFSSIKAYSLHLDSFGSQLSRTKEIDLLVLFGGHTPLLVDALLDLGCRVVTLILSVDILEDVEKLLDEHLLALVDVPGGESAAAAKSGRVELKRASHSAG